MTLSRFHATVPMIHVEIRVTCSSMDEIGHTSTCYIDISFPSRCARLEGSISLYIYMYIYIRMNVCMNVVVMVVVFDEYRYEADDLGCCWLTIRIEYCLEDEDI
jgi:hypothetical protein